MTVDLGNPHLHRPPLCLLRGTLSPLQLGSAAASLYKSWLTRAVCLTFICLVFCRSAFPVHVHFGLFCLSRLDDLQITIAPPRNPIDNQRPLTSRVEALNHSLTQHQHYHQYGESRARRVYYHAHGVDNCVAHLSDHCHDRAAEHQQQRSLDIAGARPVLLQGTPTTSTYSCDPLTPPQADTSNFTADQQTILDKIKDAGNDVNINNDLLNALTETARSKALKDFYQVGLWSYCEGEVTDGVEKITHCSSSNSQFWFNPVEVWNLQNTNVQNVLGDDLQKGLNTYKKIAGWMNWAFIIATVLTAAEFVVGFFAIFSRWGSLVTTILSTVSSVSSNASKTRTNII